MHEHMMVKYNRNIKRNEAKKLSITDALDSISNGSFKPRNIVSDNPSDYPSAEISIYIVCKTYNSR